jgi:hypothetical protein
MPRAKGSKNRRTLERETAKKIAAARAELVKNGPPLDFSMPLDSLDVMEQAVRHFYFRAKIEERLGDGADWRRLDQAFMQAVHVAEKVARYRHAQFSAVKLGGGINAQNHDNVTLEELLEQIKVETVKLAPYIDLDAIREAQGVANRLPATGKGSEPEAISPRRRPPRCMGDSSG